MDEVLAHQDEHDQGTWINDCGTAGCFAFYLLKVSGRVRRFVPEDGAVVLHNGRWASDPIMLAAQSVAGLTADEAYELFLGDNTVAELKDHVDRLCGDAR